MAIITPADEQIAADATRIVGEFEKPLVITGSQIVRWRLAGLFDVGEEGRRGRGNTRVYPANAPQVAARFALALAEDRNLDEAMLSSFAGGLEVARPGLQSAYDHFFRWMSRKIAQSPTKPTRVKIPGAAADASGALASRLFDAMRNVFAGIDLTPQLAADLIGHIAGPEGLDLLVAPDGSTSHLVQLLKSLSVGALRQTVRRSSQSELSWAVKCVDTMIEYVTTLSEFFDETSSQGASPLAVVMANIGRTARRTKVSRALAQAVAAPAVLLVAGNAAGRSQLEEALAACRTELPKLKAILALVGDMPAEVRHFLGIGGSAALEMRSDEFREQLRTLITPWLQEHPNEAAVLVP